MSHCGICIFGSMGTRSPFLGHPKLFSSPSFETSFRIYWAIWTPMISKLDEMAQRQGNSHMSSGIDGQLLLMSTRSLTRGETLKLSGVQAVLRWAEKE